MWEPVFKGPRKSGGTGRVVTRARIEALSKQMAQGIRADFVRGIERFRTKVDPAEMLAAYKRGKYDAVRETVPWDALEKGIRPAMGKLQPAMSFGADNGKAMVPGGMRYDLRSETINSYLQRRTGELITTSEKGMLEAVRAATEKSFSRAATPQDVANMIRGSIGLNAPQARALANYSRKLGEDGTPGERRAELVDGYRERLLDQRAILIGRTEVRFAQNAGQRAVWDQAAADGMLPEGSGRQWVVDGNPCPELCRPMDGVIVGMDEKYTLPDGREVDSPTESHPSCYCTERLVFGRA